MTTPSTARKAGPFTGNGSQNSWPFTFKVFAAADIAVTATDANGDETLLVLNSDYTVSLNANQETSPGGTVTYLLASGRKLSVVGDLDYDQGYDIPSGGNFNPVALENQLDRMVMQTQQLAEQMVRAVKVPVTDDFTADELAADMLRLADSADNIDTVAVNIASVNSAAANIAAITNAPTAATSAASSATSAQNSATAAASSASAASASATSSANSATAAQNYIGGIIQNPILGDDVFGGDGSLTTFTLSRNIGTGNSTSLLVTISGVVQAPLAAYTATGTSIVFTSAPPNGSSVRVRYIGALAVNAAAAESAATAAAASAASAGAAEIVYVIEAMTGTITAGIKGAVEIPFNCTINSWTLLANTAGNLVVDIKKSNFAGYPPASAAITAGAPPTLSAAQKAQSSTIIGWTTSVYAGDILQFEVTGTPASIQRATLNLRVTRT